MYIFKKIIYFIIKTIRKRKIIKKCIEDDKFIYE